MSVIYEFCRDVACNISTITNTCLSSYRVDKHVFNAAGTNGENVNEWVNWMTNNF